MQSRQSTLTLESTGKPSRTEDLAFAERAAVYLDKKGMDHRAVVKCLIEEFELDLETAEAVASLAA